MRILLLMLGVALLLMWALGLVFRIGGIFIWFILGWGLISLLIGTRVQEEM